MCAAGSAALSENQAFRGLRGREASLELAFMLWLNELVDKRQNLKLLFVFDV